MSTFGDVVQALIGSEAGLADELDGSPPAPVPSVGSRPGRIADARAWTAPDASGHGQVTVHRDVLRGAAAGMRSDLRDLDGAVRRLDGARQGEGISITANIGLVAGWPTAVAFNGNASAAFTGIVAASQQTGTAHQDASSRLAVSAQAYDQSESDNLRAARSVGTNLYSVAGLVASYGSGGRPAASALGAQPSYPVRTRAVPGFSGAGMPAGAIMEILRGLSPGDVAAAGAAHTRLGTTLDLVAGRLAANARTLAQNWSGSAAQAAMGQFQQLHDHMVTLARQAQQVGSVLSWLGGDVLPQFTSLPDPRVSPASLVLGDALAGMVVGSTVAGSPVAGLLGGVTGAATGLLAEVDGSAQATADRAAQEYIARLSGYLVIADQLLPDTIGAVPAVGSGRGSGPAPAVHVTAGTSAGGSGVTVRPRPVGGGGNAVTLTGGGRGGGSVTGTDGGTRGAGATTGGTSTPGGRGGAASPSPSSLQGAMIPGGPLSPTAGTTSALGATPPLSPPGSGGLSGGGLPGPVPGVSEVTEPAFGPVVASGGGATAGVADPVSTELPGGVSADGSGLVTGVAEDQFGGLPGLSGTSGLPAADATVAGGLPGAQSQQLEADGALAEADGAIEAPDMAGFPMMGMGGAARPEEQERVRQAWLNEDGDLWGPPVNLVPPVIDGPAGRAIALSPRGRPQG